MDPMNPATRTARPRSLLDWGVAQVTLQGQTESGDSYLVTTFPNGMLVAVVDGLGHGGEAAAAAKAAIVTVGEHPEEPVIPLLQRCHEALRSTRGVTMSLASFNATYNILTWLGVGNVEGVVLRADKQAPSPQESIMLFPGVVGHHLPPLRAIASPINPGDLLILYTDGIRRDFLSEPPIPGHSPQRVADRICAKYNRGTDDALALVARYVGGPG
jgi:negative regulator of sigma-B (phosphoserine phosphatase)